MVRCQTRTPHEYFACGPRWLSGFLTLFMAFLLREHPIGGHSPQFSLGVVIGAAGLGNVAAIAAGLLIYPTALWCLGGIDAQQIRLLRQLTTR